MALYGQEACTHANARVHAVCSFSATLRVTTSVEWWMYPWRKRRMSKSSLHNLRRTRTRLPTWIRWCLPTLSGWLLFFTFVKQSTRWLAFLRRLPRTRSSQRRGKWLIFLLRIAVNWATLSIAVTNTAISIKATNAIAMIDNLTIVIKMIDAMIMVDATTRTLRATSPMTRRMIAIAITPTKRATGPWIMTSPLCWSPAICPEEGVNLVQDILCALVLGLGLAQAAKAMTTIMSTKMIASRAQPPSTDIHTPRTTMMDITVARTKAILFLPPFLLQRWRKSAPKIRESRH